MPKLPYGDSEFDFVTNVVSVDYLTKPREAPGSGHSCTRTDRGHHVTIFAYFRQSEGQTEEAEEKKKLIQTLSICSSQGGSAG